MSAACVLALTDAAAGSAARAAAVPAPAKAPAVLLAGTLLKAAKLPSVLPGLKGQQDDGGYPATYPTSSFVSQVETATPLTRLRITLTAYTSKGTAAEGFTGQYGGLTKLPGVGQRAAISLNRETAVLRGSQVLLVTVVPTPAGDDLIANAGKSTDSYDQVLQAPLLAATKALARHMNGTAAKKPYTHLPAGALNPCLMTAAALKARLKQPVIVTPSASERPPWQQCNYSLNGQTYLVQTLTHAQAATASPPLSLKGVFDADLTSRNTRHNALTATIGPLTMFMIPGQDWLGEILIKSPGKGRSAISPAASTDAVSPETGYELTRILDQYSHKVSYATCITLIEQALSAEWDEEVKADADIKAWCRKAAKA